MHKWWSEHELRNKTKRKQTNKQKIEIFLWYFLGFFLCIQFGRLAGMSTLFLVHLFSPLVEYFSLFLSLYLSHSLSLLFSLHTDSHTVLWDILQHIHMHIISAAPSSSAQSVLLCLIAFYWFIHLLQHKEKTKSMHYTHTHECVFIVACAHFYWLFCGLFLLFLFVFSSFLYGIVLIASHCGFSVIFLHTHTCVCIVRLSLILPKILSHNPSWIVYDTKLFVYEIGMWFVIIHRFMVIQSVRFIDRSTLSIFIIVNKWWEQIVSTLKENQFEIWK